ncbi:DNA gyrase inhibitor YacG [Rhodospirillum centenum]|uniref:DNA gyrase inhibitor YacG n=1 Tax=Rhodospirillum centenum (strain ATCC 51521 / SW) TaxID=414684 RepID=B6INE8_RHOCS|nr:DNA gyrase inhibitor YacG [Rhodospirillum centenum]ACI99045.1 conserved domain protein [Rhodospirillum centenum SW]
MPDDPVNLTDARQRRRAACPVCGRPADPALKPFCSRRCADVDLSRWLGGVYRVPVVDRDEDAFPDTDAPPPSS